VTEDDSNDEKSGTEVGSCGKYCKPPDLCGTLDGCSRIACPSIFTIAYILQITFTERKNMNYT